MKLQVRGAETFATTGGRPFVPEQPTIVFVHGAGMNRIVWYLQTRYFAHHGQWIFPDTVDRKAHCWVVFRNWRTGFRLCWIPQGWPRPRWLDIRWGR